MKRYNRILASDAEEFRKQRRIDRVLVHMANRQCCAFIERDESGAQPWSIAHFTPISCNAG